MSTSTTVSAVLRLLGPGSKQGRRSGIGVGGLPIVPARTQSSSSLMSRKQQGPVSQTEPVRRCQNCIGLYALEIWLPLLHVYRLRRFLGLDGLYFLPQLVDDVGRVARSLDPKHVRSRFAIQVEAQKLDMSTLSRRIKLCRDRHVLIPESQQLARKPSPSTIINREYSHSPI